MMRVCTRRRRPPRDGAVTAVEHSGMKARELMSSRADVNTITLGAYDLEALRGFYARLGWIEASVSGPGWACFETGGALLTLFPVEDLERDCFPSVPAPSRSDGAFRGLTLAVSVAREEDVDVSLEFARLAGATVLMEPEVAPWGTRTAFFADPEGNVWEIACTPGSALDELGAAPED
jgi:catechol 2,3-dioxygenase-like lactoylglutathione lyase family enzyme